MAATAKPKNEVYEILLEDIRMLQTQQQILDISLKLLRERQEHEDYALALKALRKREVDANNYMYFCVLFVLETYLNQLYRNTTETPLCKECVTEINISLELYRKSGCKFVGHQSCECEFLTALNISCARTPAGTRQQFKEKSKEFFEWLGRFLKANELDFPCAENLFFTLIICAVASKVAVKHEMEPPRTADEIIRALMFELKSRKVSAKDVLMIDVPGQPGVNARCEEVCSKGYIDKCDCCPCVCCEKA